MFQNVCRSTYTFLLVQASRTMSHNGQVAQPNTAFNEIPVAKPLNAKDIESQSLLGADLQNEWGSAEAMEKGYSTASTEH